MSLESKAKNQKLLETKKQALKEILEKYGPSLATKPHPRFKGKSLRDSVEYALNSKSLSIVRETLSSVQFHQKDMVESPKCDGYMVAYGNTYGKNELFHKYGFSLKKFGQNWAWYREILSDKQHIWSHIAENIGPGIFSIYVSTFDKIEEALSDAKEIDKEEAMQIEEEIPPHELDGCIFEVSKWYSQQFKENNNTQYAFRNIKVIKIKKESPKAYLVDAEFFAGIACRCGVCGLTLNNDISRATGIGPICAEKIGLPRPTMARAKEIVSELEKLSKAQGTFKDVWIPKSQIKNIIKELEASPTSEPI